MNLVILFSSPSEIINQPINDNKAYKHCTVVFKVWFGLGSYTFFK